MNIYDIKFSFCRKYATEYLPSEALLKAKQPKLGLSPISIENFLTGIKLFCRFNTLDSLFSVKRLLVFCGWLHHSSTDIPV